MKSWDLAVWGLVILLFVVFFQMYQGEKQKSVTLEKQQQNHHARISGLHEQIRELQKRNHELDRDIRQFEKRFFNIFQGFKKVLDDRPVLPVGGTGRVATDIPAKKSGFTLKANLLYFFVYALLIPILIALIIAWGYGIVKAEGGIERAVLTFGSFGIIFSYYTVFVNVNGIFRHIPGFYLYCRVQSCPEYVAYLCLLIPLIIGGLLTSALLICLGKPPFRCSRSFVMITVILFCFSIEMLTFQDEHMQIDDILSAQSLLMVGMVLFFIIFFPKYRRRENVL